VACGGALYVDIASQLPNAEKHDWWPTYKRNKLVHDVSISKDSHLAEIWERTNCAQTACITSRSGELQIIEIVLHTPQMALLRQ
jgi:gamma-glutamyl-gamma-aminobutyrate hydrolase PuuD